MQVEFLELIGWVSGIPSPTWQQGQLISREAELLPHLVTKRVEEPRMSVQRVSVPPTLGMQAVSLTLLEGLA
jgi:hypothetical protein